MIFKKCICVLQFGTLAQFGNAPCSHGHNVVAAVHLRVCVCVYVCMCVCAWGWVGMCFWLMFVMITEVFCGSNLL